MTQETVRPKAIFSAAVGMALAIVVGWPVSGWLNEGIMKEPETMGSFHLAKAGVDRALFQINQQKVNLDALLDGSMVPGLNGDVLYSDVPGGNYKVKAEYDSAAREFRIVGYGYESTGKNTALELRLKQQPDAQGLVQKEWREIPAES